MRLPPRCRVVHDPGEELYQYGYAIRNTLQYLLHIQQLSSHTTTCTRSCSTNRTSHDAACMHMNYGELSVTIPSQFCLAGQDQ